MRIGILTFHRPINYGAFLQAFSLSSQLAKEFPDNSVEIIDYIAPQERNKIYLNVLRTVKHQGIKAALKEIVKIRVFKESLNRLPLSPQYFCCQDENKLFRYIDNHYDILIIGSDAVFNWNQNGYPSAFIPQYTFLHCKVATYAASVHGLLYHQEAVRRIDECANAFSKIKVLGVRDDNTYKFVKYCDPNAKPIHCCDPTVFIDTKELLNQAGDYLNRILLKYGCDLNRKYIVFMMQDGEDSKAIRENFSNEYQIISLFKPSKDASYYLYDLDPFEWAAVIRGAALVVTSYFHGTLLALRQGVPAIVLDYSRYNGEEYESKLYDLIVKRVGLRELYFDVCAVRDRERKAFIEVVKTALKGNYNEQIKISIEKESHAYNNFINLLVKNCLFG